MCCEYFINNLSRMEEYRDVDIFLKMIRGTLPPFENFNRSSLNLDSLPL